MRPIDISEQKRPQRVDPGPAPVLQWLKIDDLMINDNYQRELKRRNWLAVNRIATRFKWSMFSPVFVSPVEGGRYAIIDGQHRTHAAAMCGFSEVPCQIVHMSVEEQAASFAAVNGTVTRVTSWQIYRAALAAGEPWALTARQVATEGGCELMEANASTCRKRPGCIFGVNLFRKLVEETDHGLVVLALQSLLKVPVFAERADAWTGLILIPVLEALCERGDALRQEGFVSQLRGFDLWAAVDAAEAETRRRVAEGLAPVARRDLLRSAVVAWIGETVSEPARETLPVVRAPVRVPGRALVPAVEPVAPPERKSDGPYQSIWAKGI